MKCSKCLSYPPYIPATQIINPFRNSGILANHDKVDGISVNGEVLSHCFSMVESLVIIHKSVPPEDRGSRSLVILKMGLVGLSEECMLLSLPPTLSPCNRYNILKIVVKEIGGSADKTLNNPSN